MMPLLRHNNAGLVLFQRKQWEKLMGNETYPTSSNSCQPQLNSTHTDYITGTVMAHLSAGVSNKRGLV